MTSRRPLAGIRLFVAGVALLGPGPASATSFRAGGERISVPVRSLQEIRQAGVVRQRWDFSCGAAALGTILTYDHRDPTTEAEAVLWMMRKGDPSRIARRGGFSLLDMKRFVEYKGYSASGYARMTLDELVASGPSTIVPIRLRGYDHFVVFRGLAADRVFLVDPAFGNLTMREERFRSIWKGGIAFVVRREGGSSRADSPVEATTPIPDLPFVARVIRGGGPAIPTRISP